MNQDTPEQEDPQSPQSAGPTGLGDQFMQASQAPPTPGGLAPQEQRTMGMLCHLLALAGLIGVPAGNILGPLILWLIKKDEVPFVADQGKESVNFQITAFIALIVLGVPSIIPFVWCITLPLLLGLIIAWLVFVIIATIKANNGEYYRYPFAIRFFK